MTLFQKSNYRTCLSSSKEGLACRSFSVGGIACRSIGEGRLPHDSRRVALNKTQKPKPMKTQILPFLAFLILTLYSCEKEPDIGAEGYVEITVEGRIIDVYSQEPIDSAIAQIRTAPRPSASHGLASRSVKTDSDGRFKFSFKADLDSSYFLSAISRNHYTNTGITYNENRIFNGNKPTSQAYHLKYHNPWKQTFEKDISLVPQATLRLTLINKSGTYNRFSMGPPAGSGFGFGIWATGYSVNETHEFTVYGGTEITLNTFRYRPEDQAGEGDYVPIKVTCQPHQVNDLHIEY